MIKFPKLKGITIEQQLAMYLCKWHGTEGLETILEEPSKEHPTTRLVSLLIGQRIVNAKKLFQEIKKMLKVKQHS